MRCNSRFPAWYSHRRHRPLSLLFHPLCRIEGREEDERRKWSPVYVPLYDGVFAPGLQPGTEDYWKTGARVFASSAWLAAETVATRSLWCATATAAIGLFIGMLARRGQARERV